MKKEYKMVITPALMPAERHRIQDFLRGMGYNVWAGGTCTDMSSCDIAFDIDLGPEPRTEGALLEGENGREGNHSTR